MIKKICKAKGCGNSHYGNGYCHKHYKQIEIHGHILERTRFMVNEIIEDKENNIAYIILYDAKQNEKARCVIDLDDVGKIKNYRWNFRKNLYVAHFIDYCKVKDRRLVYYLINDTDGKPVYYKNGNALDCRKENLTLNKNEARKRIYKNNPNSKKCEIKDCENLAVGQGYCDKHYRTFVRNTKKE